MVLYTLYRTIGILLSTITPPDFTEVRRYSCV